MWLSILPDIKALLEFFEISSATKEVATLSKGILKSFEILLNRVMDTAAEANSTAPNKKN